MDKKTAVQELMELDTFLKIMGVTIEWDKYLEKEKENLKEAFTTGHFAPDFTEFDVSADDLSEQYYNQNYGDGK